MRAQLWALALIATFSVDKSYSQALVRKLPIRVAVIDTGISRDRMDDESLCKEGHKDFTGTGLHDNHGHGTHIYGLIDQYAKGIILKQGQDISKLTNKKINYCQIIIKFYNSEHSPLNGLSVIKKALRHAIDLKVDIINISAGGTLPDEQEFLLIKEALDKNILIVAAAGNNGQNIVRKPKKTSDGQYFPALYDDRIVVIGNGIDESTHAKTSNHGENVDHWELGMDVLSFGPTGLVKMSGTSQSAAIFTGKFIRFALSQL